MDSYFVLTAGPDGNYFKGPLTQEQLKEEIKEHVESNDGAITFSKEIPDSDNFCFMMDDCEMLIIQGKIIQPKPDKIVESWKIS